MFQVISWPRAILHVDADAFFASVTQITNPKLKGRPLVTGAERGIATSVSYEAKKLGVVRGMRVSQIRSLFPSCVVANSDYELYGLFSKNLFTILRSFTPLVEEYSPDEGFADIQGLQRPLNASYSEIGGLIKKKIESSLGITVSVGISLTKTLAKIASNSNKPSGLVTINGLNIEKALYNTKPEEVWGIGPQTGAYLKKLGINNALDFAQKDQYFIKKYFTKPTQETWQELRGNQVYQLNPNQKEVFKSITKSATFYPAINDKKVLWSKTLTHIEDAFGKLRRYCYKAGRVTIFLKTQKFTYHMTQINLAPITCYPLLFHSDLYKAFENIYKANVLYRTSGCTLSNFCDDLNIQPSLFCDSIQETKAQKIYDVFKSVKVDFGTSLFDKQKAIENTKPKKFSLSLVSFDHL
jgi:DNA polymerase-4/DNA polymerase V